MSVTVDPAEFTFVDFDAGRIGEITSEVAASLGFDPTTDIVVQVDERIPFGNHELRGLDPIHCFVESGALEHAQRVRKLSEEGTREMVGRLLIEARDRLDPTFGAPPLGEAVDLPPPRRLGRVLDRPAGPAGGPQPAAAPAVPVPQPTRVRRPRRRRVRSPVVSRLADLRRDLRDQRLRPPVGGVIGRHPARAACSPRPS